MEEQIDALGVQLAQEVQEVGERSAKPIDRPDGDHVDLTPSNRLHHGSEARTQVASFGWTISTILVIEIVAKR